MRFVVTFNDTGTEGVMVFTAIDMEDAYRFISDPNIFMTYLKYLLLYPFLATLPTCTSCFLSKRAKVKKVDWRVSVQWLWEGLLLDIYPPLPTTR